MASVIRGDDNFDSANVGPSTNFGDVGTYVFAGPNAFTFSAINPGDTISGSSIYPMAIHDLPTYSEVKFDLKFIALSGTWRCMGWVDSQTNQGITLRAATAFVRIS